MVTDINSYFFLIKKVKKITILTFIGREKTIIVTFFSTWQNGEDLRDSSGWVLTPIARWWQSWKGFQMSLLTIKQQNPE